MNFVRPLAITCRLHPGEPAQGYASRLAAANGRPMGQFLRDQKIHPRDIDLGQPAAVERLALLGSCDADELMRFTPHRPEDKDVMHLGSEVFSRLSITRTYFKYCPHCLSDDLKCDDGKPLVRPWLRHLWIIDHVRSCPIHQTALLRAKPFRQRFEPFDFAAHMQVIVTDLDQHKISTGPAQPSAFQWWIENRVAGYEDATWLANFSMFAAIDVIEALGISALHPPKVQVTSLTQEQIAEAAEAGFRIAAGGEIEIRSLLARLVRAQDNTRGYIGLRDTFGYLWHRLVITRDRPEYDPIRAIVRQFALENVPVAPGTDVLGHKTTGHNLHTVRTASITSGVHARTVRRLFERQGWTTDRKAGGAADHRVVVAADLIEKTVEDLKGALTTPKVLKLTGFDRQHFFKAVRAGYIETVLNTKEVEDAKHRFTRAAADTMMTRFFAGAVAIKVPEPRQMNIVDARRVATASIDDLLRWIFTNDLKWKGRIAGRSDYFALLLDVDEIIARVRAGAPRVNFTKHEVAEREIVGMGRNSVEKFIAAGALKTTTEFSNDARRMIDVVTAESVEAFRREFVCLGELCRHTGLHHKQVRMVLREEGVDECFDYKQVKTFVYRREDVAGLIFTT